MTNLSKQKQPNRLTVINNLIKLDWFEKIIAHLAVQKYFISIIELKHGIIFNNKYGAHLSELCSCFTFRKSAKADFLLDSALATSIAALKLLM